MKFTPSSLSCPVCGAWSVRPIGGRIRLKPPSHRCTQCGSDLKAEFSIRALWAVPVGLLLFGIAGALTILLPTAITGVFRDTIVGGAWGLAGVVCARIALRGLVLRACES